MERSPSWQGIDLQTGEAIPLIRESHNSDDYIDFLKILDAKYPKGNKILLVLDNLKVHTSEATKEYLATVPGRFEFVFTPKPWLLAQHDRRFLQQNDKTDASGYSG